LKKSFLGKNSNADIEFTPRKIARIGFCISLNKQMQPILTAEWFMKNVGQFQVQLVCVGSSDAVKTAD